jgi:hypothetical protein
MAVSCASSHTAEKRPALRAVTVAAVGGADGSRGSNGAFLAVASPVMRAL